ncbi:hypothetical protein [Streptomyces flavidovirens]|uniref:hypothetical protein n=1 Tax=Streptomyces flavidovirens TaxID=67298 RepID=UPI0036C4C30D
MPLAPGRAGAAAPSRRGPADPVRALMHRHRELCERAVDPLEIAAGLEAHGVTDRTAARFRHRDVFALAEELYARVPRAGDSAGPVPVRETPAHAGWIVYALLPGVACALTAAGIELATGRVSLVVGVAGALVVAVTLALCLRHGPLRAEGRPAPAARLWVCWLLGYAVFGDGLLGELIEGGPDGPWPMDATTLAALAAAPAPAAWCAHLLAVRARRKLAVSRGTEAFGASVRPLLLGVTGLFVGVLVCFQIAVAAVAAAGASGAVGSVTGGSGPAALAAGVALGALLFLARLLTVHGFPRPASAGLAAAAALQVTALCAVLAARLPGCGFLARPVERLVDAGGVGAVPAVACAVAALALLVHATAALSRTSAHAARNGTRTRTGTDDPKGPDGRDSPDGRHGPH